MSQGLFTLGFLQNLLGMTAVAWPLPWCTETKTKLIDYSKVSNRPFGAMLLGGDSGNAGSRVLNCTLWDELGLGNASSPGPGPPGPPARPFASALRPTLLDVSHGHYNGFAGWERTIGDKVEEVAGVVAAGAVQRLRSHAELQMSLSDATATWRGALTSAALLLVSWIAVAGGRRDMEQTLDRWLRRGLDCCWPGAQGHARADAVFSVMSKAAVFVISALGILLPLVLVVMAEQAARRSNTFPPKITWFQEDAPTYENQK